MWNGPLRKQLLDPAVASLRVTYQYDHKLLHPGHALISKPSATTTFNIEMASQPPQEPAKQADSTQNPQQAEEETGYAPLVDPRLPTRKDTSLREFLSKIDDYAPIVRAPS